MSEVYRGSILAVPKNQWEAAATIGLSKARTLQRIILPQALRIVTPTLGNYFISLFKDTALASVVTVQELTFTGQIISARSYQYFTIYTSLPSSTFPSAIPRLSLFAGLSNAPSTASGRARYDRARRHQKGFGNHGVLCGINETFATGEVTCIIGPSGSGKSTLLRCINLLEQPTSGEIIIEGEIAYYDIVDGKARLHAEARISKVRRKLGMVFQDFALFPHLTALGNVTEGLIYASLRKVRQRQLRTTCWHASASPITPDITG